MLAGAIVRERRRRRREQYAFEKTSNQSEYSFDLRERERMKRLSVSPRFFLDLLRREYSSCFVCSILCDKCLLDIWTSITIEGLSFILNFLGFLYLSRENKGDYALQDIYTALHWLKNYVTNFNGDPDRITLYGTGSGAVLASLVVMLETVNGLCQMKSSSSKKNPSLVFRWNGKD